MAKVDPKEGKYKLGGSKDADLEGIDDKKYNVFTDEEKLANAKRDFPTYTWFASYTIQDKNGNNVRELAEYTIKFDKPDVDNFQFYYYLNGQAYPLPHEVDNKRAKVKLKVGDPPTGTVP